MNIEDEETNGSLEQLFLSAMERGDAQAIRYALKHRHALNTNAVDASGRSAMLIALENGHIELLKLLLQYDICITDSLLYAVDIQFYKAVEVICTFSKTLKDKGIDIINARPQGEDFHPVITPIMLAAHHNNYDIIKLLLSYGATIEDPESASEVTEKHTLQHSLGSLLVYRGLASEAYITLTSIDPINRAFILSKKLRQLSEREVEFGDEFTELERQCETLAAELFAQTRSTEETTTILTYNPKEWATTGGVNVDLPHKCIEAVVYQQKKFMAHPHCQQYLIERWYRGLTNWRETGMVKRMLTSLLIMLFFPVLSLVYILFPHKKVTEFFRIAYVKFVMHTGSALMFLLLIFLSLFRIEDWVANGQALNSIESYELSILRDSTRGRVPTVIEFLMLAWIIGMTWREMKQVWSDGLKKYLTDSWNLMDFLSLCFYWVSYTLMMISWLRWRRAYDELDAGGVSDYTRKRRMTVEELHNYTETVSFPQIQGYIDSAVAEIIANTTAINSQQLTQFMETLVTRLSGISDTPTASTANSDTVSEILAKHHDENIILESRLTWDPYDPDLVVEGLFSLANILTVLRMINIVIMSKQVGPLQISLWGMFNDIVKFLAIFCFVLLAFTIGLTQLYKFYSTLTIIDCMDNQTACAGGFTSFINTLRTLFWNLFGLIVLQDLDTNADHVLTEGIGEFAFALYHILGIIILLNALIAMMSNTYTRIEENSDTEWKFARAQLWLDYIQQGSTVPPPFNVIPSVKTVYRFLVQIKYLICPRLRRKRTKKRKAAKAEFENNYEMISQQLVTRYWADKRSSSKEAEKPVTQFDILKIKQDISSFRYDMLTNHQRNEKVVTGMSDSTKEMMKKVQDIQTSVDDRFDALSRDKDLLNRVLEIQETLNALVHRQQTYDALNISTNREDGENNEIEHMDSYPELVANQPEVGPRLPEHTEPTPQENANQQGVVAEVIIESNQESPRTPEIQTEGDQLDLDVESRSASDNGSEGVQGDDESDPSNVRDQQALTGENGGPAEHVPRDIRANQVGEDDQVSAVQRDYFGFPRWFKRSSSLSGNRSKQFAQKK